LFIRLNPENQGVFTMRAVITVLGKDRVGIIASISNILSDSNVNILDISQTLMQDVFTMIMLADVSNSKAPFDALSDTLEAKGKELGLYVKIQHEDIFNSMHRI
jgi:ACT domain-containing protein